MECRFCHEWHQRPCSFLASNMIGLPRFSKFTIGRKCVSTNRELRKLLKNSKKVRKFILAYFLDRVSWLAVRFESVSKRVSIDQFLWQPIMIPIPKIPTKIITSLIRSINSCTPRRAAPRRTAIYASGEFPILIVRVMRNTNTDCPSILYDDWLRVLRANHITIFKWSTPPFTITPPLQLYYTFRLSPSKHKLITHKFIAARYRLYRDRLIPKISCTKVGAWSQSGPCFHFGSRLPTT